MANPRTRARAMKSLERETGFEPATSTLARSHSTTELLPLDCFILDKALCSVKPENPAKLWTPAYLLTAVRRFVEGTGPLRVQLRCHHLTVAEVQDAIAVVGRLGVVGD